MEVKQVKTDYLPHLSIPYTKAYILQNHNTVQSDFNKKMKGKQRIMNPKTDELNKEFEGEMVKEV